jgi:hypothetical protein
MKIKIPGKNTLKGNVLVNNTWTPRTYWKDGHLVKARPMCNDRFIQEVVLPQCTPYMDRNIINTCYTEKQILDGLKNTMWDIKDALEMGDKLIADPDGTLDAIAELYGQRIWLPHRTPRGGKKIETK